MLLDEVAPAVRKQGLHVQPLCFFDLLQLPVVGPVLYVDYAGWMQEEHDHLGQSDDAERLEAVAHEIVLAVLHCGGVRVGDVILDELHRHASKPDANEDNNQDQLLGEGIVLNGRLLVAAVCASSIVALLQVNLVHLGVDPNLQVDIGQNKDRPQRGAE